MAAILARSCVSEAGSPGYDQYAQAHGCGTGNGKMNPVEFGKHLQTPGMVDTEPPLSAGLLSSGVIFGLLAFLFLLLFFVQQRSKQRWPWHKQCYKCGEKGKNSYRFVVEDQQSTIPSKFSSFKQRRVICGDCDCKKAEEQDV